MTRDVLDRTDSLRRSAAWWVESVPAEWDLVCPLAWSDDETVVCKQYRDSFADTDLKETLELLGVTRLVVAGAQLEYCIRATTQRAAIERFDVTLVNDTHTTKDSAWNGVAVTGERIMAAHKHVLLRVALSRPAIHY